MISGRFQTGQSGNPRGPRPRGESIAEIFRRCADPHELYEILATIARTGGRSSDRIAAAQAILDRGWGKPLATLDLRTSLESAPEDEALDTQLDGLSDVELELLARLGLAPAHRALELPAVPAVPAAPAEPDPEPAPDVEP